MDFILWRSGNLYWFVDLGSKSYRNDRRRTVFHHAIKVGKYTSLHFTSPRLTSPHLTSPHLTSPHLTSLHFTSPHLTSPHFTSPHLTSLHLTSLINFLYNFSGFIIEFGTIFTVLLASNLGIPISTTHCLVGSVILVGFVRSRNITNWKVVRSILFAWLVTVPISGDDF